MKYDYLIVGAGLFGAVLANEMKKDKKSKTKKKRTKSYTIRTGSQNGLQKQICYL